MSTAPEAHVELIRSKLVAHYGSMTKAASELSLHTMSGGQLLMAMRTLPIHAGLAHLIEQVIGFDPNCVSCSEEAAES